MRELRVIFFLSNQFKMASALLLLAIVKKHHRYD